MMVAGDKYYFFFLNGELRELHKYDGKYSTIVCYNIIFDDQNDGWIGQIATWPEIDLDIEQKEYVYTASTNNKYKNVYKLVPLPKELVHFYE